ncbi:unnamed protein product [Spodoptera exigua]|nr:unnamed protein product [Spodoptera exigua]
MGFLLQITRFLTAPQSLVVFTDIKLVTEVDCGAVLQPDAADHKACGVTRTYSSLAVSLLPLRSEPTQNFNNMNKETRGSYSGQQGGAKSGLGGKGSYLENGLRFLFKPNFVRPPGLVGAPGIVRVPGGILYVPASVVSTPAGIMRPPPDIMRASSGLGVESLQIRPIKAWRGPGVGQGLGGVEKDGVITPSRPYDVGKINTVPDWIERRPGSVEKLDTLEIKPGGSQTEPSHIGRGHGSKPLGLEFGFNGKKSRMSSLREPHHEAFLFLSLCIMAWIKVPAGHTVTVCFTMVTTMVVLVQTMAQSERNKEATNSACASSKDTLHDRRHSRHRGLRQSHMIRTKSSVLLLKNHQTTRDGAHLGRYPASLLVM